jgi:hypothetical protein
MSRLPNSPKEKADPRSLRQRKTLATCVSTMAARQAVVACMYKGALGDSGWLWAQPPPRSTKKNVAMAAVASRGPRKR